MQNPRKHVKHRATARVLLVSEDQEVLLYKTHFDPEVMLPPRWLVPGGGIDPGETPAEAAVRELFEETGLAVTEEQLGDPIWVSSGTWLWGDDIHSHTYMDTIYRLNVVRFIPDTSKFTDDERRDVLDIRWWTIDELLASGEPVSPHDLPEYLSLLSNSV